MHADRHKRSPFHGLVVRDSVSGSAMACSPSSGWRHSALRLSSPSRSRGGSHRDLRMTAGHEAGTRHRIAQAGGREAAHGVRSRFRAARNGRVPKSALEAMESGHVDAALVQGGLDMLDYPDLRQVAVLHDEPLHLLVKNEIYPCGLPQPRRVVAARRSIWASEAAGPTYWPTRSWRSAGCGPSSTISRALRAMPNCRGDRRVSVTRRGVHRLDPPLADRSPPGHEAPLPPDVAAVPRGVRPRGPQPGHARPHSKRETPDRSAAGVRCHDPAFAYEIRPASRRRRSTRSARDCCWSPAKTSPRQPRSGASSKLVLNFSVLPGARADARCPGVRVPPPELPWHDGTKDYIRRKSPADRRRRHRPD